MVLVSSVHGPPPPPVAAAYASLIASIIALVGVSRPSSSSDKGTASVWTASSNTKSAFEVIVKSPDTSAIEWATPPTAVIFPAELRTNAELFTLRPASE